METRIVGCSTRRSSASPTAAGLDMWGDMEVDLEAGRSGPWWCQGGCGCSACWAGRRTAISPGTGCGVWEDIILVEQGPQPQALRRRR